MTVEMTEVEMRIGQTLSVGKYRVTVVDIDDDEVVVRIDDSSGPEPIEFKLRPR